MSSKVVRNPLDCDRPLPAPAITREAILRKHLRVLVEKTVVRGGWKEFPEESVERSIDLLEERIKKMDQRDAKLHARRNGFFSRFFSALHRLFKMLRR